ncbi:unnamed protein product [Prunus brigantina]
MSSWTSKTIEYVQLMCCSSQGINVEGSHPKGIDEVAAEWKLLLVYLRRKHRDYKYGTAQF